MAGMINSVIYTRPAAGQTDQRLTVDATVGGVSGTTYDGNSVDTVDLDVQDADCMVTFDASAPTTTNGHRLYATRSYTWSTARWNAAKFIRLTATSAVVHASPSAI